MGACCFTPTKRDFLWWYWLLLVSIVGIPMLLAVLYVSMKRAEDEEAKKRLGEGAAYIFWGGIIVTALLSAVVVYACVTSWAAEQRSAEEREPVYWASPHEVYGDHNLVGYRVLALQFVTALVAAASTNELIRKRKWYARIPLLFFCITLYVFILILFGCAYLFLPINLIQFLVCMIPAHYWGEFKIEPTPGRAWKALIAFVGTAPFFFAVVYFAEGLNPTLFK